LKMPPSHFPHQLGIRPARTELSAHNPEGCSRKPELRVVDDQFGAPTSSLAIAEATARALQVPAAQGLYHMTAGGQTSWLGFAQTILRNAAISTPVAPIRSDQYPAKAARPRNSVLDNSLLKETFGMSLPDWESQLEQVIAQVLARQID